MKRTAFVCLLLSCPGLASAARPYDCLYLPALSEGRPVIIAIPDSVVEPASKECLSRHIERWTGTSPDIRLMPEEKALEAVEKLEINVAVLKANSTGGSLNLQALGSAIWPDSAAMAESSHSGHDADWKALGHLTLNKTQRTSELKADATGGSLNLQALESAIWPDSATITAPSHLGHDADLKSLGHLTRNKTQGTPEWPADYRDLFEKLEPKALLESNAPDSSQHFVLYEIACP